MILCLDGLDLHLITAYGCAGLLLQEHGELEVPISRRYGLPHSPDVWASFLTGHWYDHLRFTRSPCVQGFLDGMHWLRDHLGSSLGLGRLGQYFYDHTTHRFPPIDVPDLDAYNMPFINHNHYGLQILQRYTRNGCNRREALDALQDLYHHEQQYIRKFRHFLYYMEFPDLIQHLETVELQPLYEDLTRFASTFPTLIIVSDHGFNVNTGLHTDKGFYASTHPLTPKPLKITDFHAHKFYVNTLG